MTLKEFLSIVSDTGLLGFLVIVIYTGLKKKWVFGWYVEEIAKDRDEWKEAAKAGTYLARTAVTTAESVVSAAERSG